jgi:hypothetical protein
VRPGRAEGLNRRDATTGTVRLPTAGPRGVSPVASRRYRPTRPLYLQVTGILDRLGVAAVGSPTTAILIALSVTGLVLLDARPRRHA